MDILEETICSIANIQKNASKSGYDLGYERGFVAGKVVGLQKAIDTVKSNVKAEPGITILKCFVCKNDYIPRDSVDVKAPGIYVCDKCASLDSD